MFFFVLCEEASTWIDLFHLKVDLIKINSSRFELTQLELNPINSNWIDLTIRILPIPSWQGVFLWHSDITKSNKCWLVVTWIQEQDPSTLVFFFLKPKSDISHWVSTFFLSVSWAMTYLVIASRHAEYGTYAYINSVYFWY